MRRPPNRATFYRRPRTEPGAQSCIARAAGTTNLPNPAAISGARESRSAQSHWRQLRAQSTLTIGTVGPRVSQSLQMIMHDRAVADRSLRSVTASRHNPPILAPSPRAKSASDPGAAYRGLFAAVLGCAHLGTWAGRVLGPARSPLSCPATSRLEIRFGTFVLTSGSSPSHPPHSTASFSQYATGNY